MSSTDKSRELRVTLNLVNEKVKFSGQTEGQVPVSIDYTPPLGDNQGYTSLELFLLSLSSCVGTAVAAFLRKSGKTVNEFSIEANGIRKEEHPTCFSSITLGLYLPSPEISDEDLNKILARTDEKLCPVWAMIRGNVEVNIRRITNVPV